MTVNVDTQSLIASMRDVVGQAYLLTDKAKKQPYTKGFRFGAGEALAVVRPGTLVEIWRVLKLCVEADVAVIMQAANTGLTGGSTPDGKDYDRPLVIISTMRIDDIQLVDNGKQIVGLAGSTLFGLEETLAPYGREPHSVIGSSCIGASIVGGICNNSGGALVKRGPAYTELALFAQIDANGNLSLVNNLGINLGSEPEEILNNLENKRYKEADVQHPDARASDNEYDERVRDVDSDTPSRFNNDGRRLHEASGCAGKLAVFAVRLDTFPIPEKKQVFYVGSNDAAVFTKVRRDILSTFKNLPDSGEYLHRDCYDVSKKYGKDMFIVISKLGAKFIPKLFAFKRKFDAFTDKLGFLPNKMSDRVMQYMSYVFPNHLPKRMEEYRDKYQHHWILEMSNDGVDEAKAYLDAFFKTNEGSYFECTEEEADKAILHRFVAGGAIGRYHVMHSKDVGAMMTIDVALRRNDPDWFEVLPKEIDDQIDTKLYYGHLFCHVMHQNYVLKKGADAKLLKGKILETFDARSAEYPAEHNVGHEYFAKDALKNFYRELDPTNSFNPGIGKTTKLKNWAEHDGSCCGGHH
ncbi:quinone-dependent D-lactate dehydrogenase [Alteromonas macleodii]|jgi:D-lactate dehydrogenase|uniref:Quinone-dependent D-lactate dehydrogenase n=1 Tax=Alteromonas macleodii (strain English Channel 673) TaxID=1004788 RepID=A0AB33A266_ALTME|nr:MULTISPECIES: D-lactate dehydrogenase [Alteromonas]MED5380287.1 D-lactate dehydrogenase [Pseudomonadota bacterium]RUM31848.1 MAG: D-lactate dehydrogenase [Alteromonas sp.]AFT75866.1 D-lactate dehydrogenase [Alteromonas macleodii str. 'English Channel 673']MBL3812147.1 D-lactate dehydrogenase [Alteromonas macleodii]MBL3885706.1 D-lactate dehydrogenase [Alteromonas macleodii]|tara:strand:- start:8 stop:1741 length:1734 start_codon:yes stop_codon:yes gene_type:complete